MAARLGAATPCEGEGEGRPAVGIGGGTARLTAGTACEGDGVEA